MEKSSAYEFLEKCASGEIKEIDKWDIRKIDDLLEGFKPSANKPTASKIKLQFDSDEDYFKLFDIEEYDLSIMTTVLNSSWEFLDSYSARDSEWDEGYILSYFNESNKKIIEEILLLTNPSLIGGEDKEIAEHLSNLFEREVDNIIYEYSYAVDEASNKNVVEDIEATFCNKLERIGLFKQYCYYTYFTTVGILLNLYKFVGDYSLDLSELLTQVIEKQNLDVSPGYSDNIYDYINYQPEGDGFNNSSELYLNKMLDKAQDMDNTEFDTKLISDIFKKYSKDRNHVLPKDSNITFRIEGFDPKKNKLDVRLYNKKTSTNSGRMISPEDFNSFLTNYELFEHKKIKKIIREKLKNLK